jgi:hypothetical protein
MLFFYFFCFGVFSSIFWCQSFVKIPKGSYEGFYYRGELDKEGCPHGKGELKGKDPNGHKIWIQGDFLHCEANGNVKAKIEGLGQYEGEMKNSKRHGYGTLTYSDKRIYEGDWSYNLKHGIGSLSYPNGDYDQGQYANDQLNGYGIWFRIIKYVYFGEFVNGSPSGIGYVKRYDTDRKYVGKWEKDSQDNILKLEGLSSISYPDGKTIQYLGQFNKGTPAGWLGEQTENGEIRFLGNVKNGNAVGMSYLRFGQDNEQEFLGELKNGVPQGIGYLNQPHNNSQFYGFFKENHKRGKGMTVTETSTDIADQWNSENQVFFKPISFSKDVFTGINLPTENQ